MDIDRIMRIVFIGFVFAVVYTLSKPLTLSILVGLGVIVLVMQYRTLKDKQTK